MIEAFFLSPFVQALIAALIVLVFTTFQGMEVGLALAVFVILYRIIRLEENSNGES